MQLRTVDTTPNPNSMKLNLDCTFAKAGTYTRADKSDCPAFIEELLAIEGVKSVFACSDFITLNRDPRADWQPILEQATTILGRAPGEHGEKNEIEAAAELKIQAQRDAAQREGQVQVFVQTFLGIPIQVKAVDQHSEKRISLGARFDAAAQAAQAESGADFLKERCWIDHGVRYGPLEVVADEVAEELRGTCDQSRLDHIKDESPSITVLTQWLSGEDWHGRLLAVQTLSTMDGNIALLALALKDSNSQVRRLAAAALGATGNAEAVAPLSEVLLHDPNIGVRRTAGDALSDIGDVAAQPAVCQALADPNKLVRWRAARFLSDVGGEDALPYLEAAADDDEFEVRLEVEAAMQRIRGGGQGLGPAWKRIIGQH